MEKLKFLTLILLFFVAFTRVSGQYDPPATSKVKAMVVYEEKLNTLISKKVKDTEITYDKNGNILESILYKEGKVTEHFKYQYDANGNKIKEEEYDPNGKLLETSEYKIENNLRMEKIVYDSNRKIISRKTYTYTFH
jgi:antitoxin component YwqK of YwqJK toxin-antitoxin module